MFPACSDVRSRSARRFSMSAACWDNLVSWASVSVPKEPEAHGVHFRLCDPRVKSGYHPILILYAAIRVASEWYYTACCRILLLDHIISCIHARRSKRKELRFNDLDARKLLKLSDNVATYLREESQCQPKVVARRWVLSGHDLSKYPSNPIFVGMNHKTSWSNPHLNSWVLLKCHEGKSWCRCLLRILWAIPCFARASSRTKTVKYVSSAVPLLQLIHSLPERLQYARHAGPNEGHHTVLNNLQGQFITFPRHMSCGAQNPYIQKLSTCLLHC